MRLLVSVVLLSALCGCDQIKDDGRANATREAQRRAAELADFREGMVRLVDGKLKLSKEALAKAEKEALSVRKDLDMFTQASTAAMNEKDAKGVSLSLADRLLHLLRNSQVNALATRYLKTDLARDASTLDEQVRAAQAEEQRYFEAMKKEDGLYADDLNDSSKWLAATREQREKEILRLKQEIATLESTRSTVLKNLESQTRKKLQSGPDAHATERERYYVLQHRLSDMDSEIEKKRRQIDGLTHPDATRRLESQAASEKQHLQLRANTRHEQSLRDIERHLKPKRMVLDIVSEYEKKTVRVLQKAISDESDKLQKQVETLTAQVEKLAEAKLLVPVSSLEELQRMRKSL